MSTLSNIGRILYGIAMAGMGFQTIYNKDFPYMLFPPKHSWVPGLVPLTYIFGAMVALAGAFIVFGKRPRPVSLLLGGLLLSIFCFGFIPYQFLVNSNYMHFGEWENAEKELALSGGAFIIAGCFAGENESSVFRFLAKLVPFGAIVFSLMIICFGIAHFLDPRDVAEYIPAWIPFRLFWAYFAGIALIGSGIAIIFKIKPALFAALLGTMIFIWFIILHMPRVIGSQFPYLGGELTSALLALAYGGIGYVIAGAAKKQNAS